MVNAIGTLLCPVTDMDRSVRFYGDGLGLRSIYHSPYWSTFELGSVRIGLHPVTDGLVNGGGGWVVAFEVEDIAALRKHLADIGHPSNAEYHQTPAGVVMDFSDPDGNPLQAMQLGSDLKDFHRDSTDL